MVSLTKSNFFFLLKHWKIPAHCFLNCSNPSPFPCQNSIIADSLLIKDKNMTLTNHSSLGGTSTDFYLVTNNKDAATYKFINNIFFGLLICNTEKLYNNKIEKSRESSTQLSFSPIYLRSFRKQLPYSTPTRQAYKLHFATYIYNLMWKLQETILELMMMFPESNITRHLVPSSLISTPKSAHHAL